MSAAFSKCKESPSLTFVSRTAVGGYYSEHVPGNEQSRRVRINFEVATRLCTQTRLSANWLVSPTDASGLVPDGGPCARLQRLIGRRRGADDIRGDSPELYGNVNRSLPAADLDEFVDALCGKFICQSRARS